MMALKSLDLSKLDEYVIITEKEMENFLSAFEDPLPNNQKAAIQIIKRFIEHNCMNDDPKTESLMKESDEETADSSYSELGFESSPEKDGSVSSEDLPNAKRSK